MTRARGASGARSIGWGEADVVDLALDADVDARAAFLSAPERARLATQRSPRRRGEFVAGRLAVRRAIAAIAGEPAVVDLVVDRHDDGAPRLLGLDGVAVSITHATRRAFAIAAHGDAPLGLDLCEHGDAARIRRIARRAFPRAHERDLVLETDAAACLAWAAKESVAKALRIGMLEGAGVERIEVVSIDPLRVTLDGVAPALRFEVRAVDEGFLVVVC